MNKSANNSAPACAAEFFQYRYPPFADTYEIRQPFLSQAETLIVQRSLALVNQGKSLAIYGEAGAGKVHAHQIHHPTARLKILPRRYYPLWRNETIRYFARNLRGLRH